VSSYVQVENGLSFISTTSVACILVGVTSRLASCALSHDEEASDRRFRRLIRFGRRMDDGEWNDVFIFNSFVNSSDICVLTIR
jgi:hypothetical protein